MVSSQVDVSYAIADKSVLDEYNTQYGTAYEMFDASNVKLSSATSTIPSGKLYAENVQLELSNLETLEEGNHMPCRCVYSRLLYRLFPEQALLISFSLNL